MFEHTKRANMSARGSLRIVTVATLLMAASWVSALEHGDQIPKTSLSIHYPEIILDDLQEAEGILAPKKVTLQGLPKEHSCVCLNLNNPMAPPIVPVSLLEELSKTEAAKGGSVEGAQALLRGDVPDEDMAEEGSTSTKGKKANVKMVCYCGAPSARDYTISEALKPVPGEEYDYLKPFTHRPFDRKYANKGYDGPRYQELWNDHDRYRYHFQDDHDKEHDYMKEFSSDLSESAMSQADNFDVPSFNEKKSDVQNPEKPHPSKKTTGSGGIEIPGKDGEPDRGGMMDAITAGTESCSDLKKKHQDLYRLMAGFFGEHMTPRSCKFWKDWLKQMHTTLKIKLDSNQVANLKQLMHCVC